MCILALILTSSDTCKPAVILLQEDYQARIPLPSQLTMLFHHGGRMYVTLWPSPPQQAGRYRLLQFVELLP